MIKKWFQVFPYYGWLAGFVISLGLAISVYHWERIQYDEDVLVKTVQKEFNRTEALVLHNWQSSKFNTELKSSHQKEKDRDYYLFVVADGAVVSWNTNRFSLTPEIKKAPHTYLKGGVVLLNHTYCYIRAWPLDDSMGRMAITLIPLAYHYPIVNQYFRSYFVANSRIPPETLITNHPGSGAKPVMGQDKHARFYLKFEENPRENYKVGCAAWSTGVFACLFLFAWVHQVCIAISRRSRSMLLGWGLLVIFCVFNGWLRYHFLPSGFENTLIFSPELLASDTIRSLGDMLIDVLFEGWILVFLVVFTPINGIIIFKNRKADIFIKFIICLLLMLQLYYNEARNMHALVIDSKISFEVNDFTKLAAFTIIGILVLSVITICFIIILGIINELLKTFIHKSVIKYLVVIIVSYVCICFLQNEDNQLFYLATLFMSLVGLLLLDKFGLPLNTATNSKDYTNSPHTYIWFAILCAWITLEIFYFNNTKERELRKIFAQKKVQTDAAEISYAFFDLSNRLQKDTFLNKHWNGQLVNRRPEEAKALLRMPQLDQLKKYVVDFYYYQANYTPYAGSDFLADMLLKKADSLHALQGSNRHEIINIGKLPGRNNVFFGIIPVVTANKTDTVGYLGVGISRQLLPRKISVSTFLESNSNATDQQYLKNYAYSIYYNGILKDQSGDKLFPYRNKRHYQGVEFTFKEEWSQSVLNYWPDHHTLVKVIYKRNLITNIISLFSYVLGVMLLLFGLVLFIRYFIVRNHHEQLRSQKLVAGLTIRSKVNLAILITVFFSLLAVGVATLAFIDLKYRDNQRKKLQGMLLYFSQNLLHYAGNKFLPSSDTSNGNQKLRDLNSRLNELAEEQGAAINLYDINGKLLASTQHELINKGYISELLRRDVFLALRSGLQSEWIGADKIGTLKYQSMYASLRNNNQDIIAYIHLPYFAAQAELNDEISSILLSLINIYAFIFFISGLSAIFISNSIIRSFKLLINQFRSIRLKHNELIKWPYRDELALLVNEYNVMIRKVEEMASKMARTEREDAWRDIARQVAHEIKNPLTPMKLNIQYLQQAIKDKRPNIEVLVTKVAETIIEQIENLNVISTEFSNFAKVPESHPELLSLEELLSTVVALFQNEENIIIQLDIKEHNLHIYADKSYFIRIFNNLIKNAIQAIPEDDTGIIEITCSRLKEDQVQIAVKDNGAGIPQDLQPKIFVPYFTSKSSGTGIGLAMTKNMVESSGGKIEFSSREGVGTTFFVQLPLAENG